MKSTFVGRCVMVAACAWACSSQDDDASGSEQSLADGAASAADAPVPPLTDDECTVGPESPDDVTLDDACIASRDVEGWRCCALNGAEYDVARNCTLPGGILRCYAGSGCGREPAHGCYREPGVDGGGRVFRTTDMYFGSVAGLVECEREFSQKVVAASSCE